MNLQCLDQLLSPRSKIANADFHIGFVLHNYYYKGFLNFVEASLLKKKKNTKALRCTLKSRVTLEYKLKWD